MHACNPCLNSDVPTTPPTRLPVAVFALTVEYEIESDISNLNSTVGVENAFVLSVI
jgi:hypothetical protein